MVAVVLPDSEDRLHSAQTYDVTWGSVMSGDTDSDAIHTLCSHSLAVHGGMITCLNEWEDVQLI